MKREGGWKKCAEGCLIMLLGVGCILLAASVPDNPIRQKSPVLDFITQARCLPLLSAVVITVLGAVMAAKQFKGAMATAGIAREELLRAAVLVGLTVLYAALVLRAGFLFPSAAYLAASMFYLNRGTRKWYVLVLLAAAFTGVATLLVPRLLNITLP